MRKPVFLLLIMCFIFSVVPVMAQTIPETSEIEWDGQSRFTVLVVGLDRRPADGLTLSVRTDTIMIISYDPATNSLGMLSIPRDMFFPLFDTGEQARVNTLFVRGNNMRPNYGPQLMMETLQWNLGIYIDAYIAFDFDAFITLIDTIGGITVDVPRTLNDPSFPDNFFRFDPFFIRAGVQQMDGATALKYARTRHPDDDYRRVDRQLQVVQAVRNQLDSPVAIQRLLARVPVLFETLQNHVHSNLGLDQMVRVGLAAMQVPSENVKTGALNERYSFQYGAIRVPDRTRLIDLMISVFGEDYTS